MPTQERYIECIPTTAMQRSGPVVLTYAWEEEVEPIKGMVIAIPLRSKTITGVVTRLLPKDTTLSYKAKAVIGIIKEIPIVPDELHQTLVHIAQYYETPLPLVYKSALPKFTKTREKDPIKKEPTEQHKKLTQEQANVVHAINTTKEYEAHLLHGPTGSGKTEIYLQAIAKVLQRGQQAIVLVPEISLTPQAFDRYTNRFGKAAVSLFHSQQTPKKRYSQWHRFATGQTDILIGPRSAILTQAKNLGLVIIDEEHESTYKQWDQHPRYDARTVARERCRINNIPLVLGSATPRAEDLWNHTQTKSIQRLTSRISGKMPTVQTIDMRNEYRAKNSLTLSLPLQEEMAEALKHKRQIVIFHNRRGNATFIQCPGCGYVETCPHCDISLIFHTTHAQSRHPLQCHHCQYSKPMPTQCPKCNHHELHHLGTGTQKIEEQIRTLFPKAKIERLDRDTLAEQHHLEKVYKQFEAGTIDIIIGTQIIAKGWDIPNVDLVGIINADTLLHRPDFRASEQAFQLLTQVAGRTGRGERIGKVILQTYDPEHPVVKAVQDYNQTQFYKSELTTRQQFRYPPFIKLIQVHIEHQKDFMAERLANQAAQAIQESGIQHTMLGPSPSYHAKKHKRHHYDIVLKVAENLSLSQQHALVKNIPDEAKIDIDPQNIL